MSEIKIDKGIPSPQIRNGGKYPLRQLQVGESFFAPAVVNNGTFYGPAKRIGIKIAVRMAIEGGVKGVRVWRVA